MKYIFVICFPLFLYGQKNIFVTSAHLPIMYKECNNLIRIELAEKCASIELICKAKNADILPDSADKNLYWLRPHQKKCKVFVYQKTENGLKIIDTLNYLAQNPPPPHLIFRRDTQQIFSGYVIKNWASMSVEIVPDAEFARDFPQEAQYFFDKIEVFLLNNGPVHTCGNASLKDRKIKKLPFSPPSVCFTNLSVFKYELRVSVVRENSAQILVPVELYKSESCFTFVVKR